MPTASGDIGVYREIFASSASSSALAFVTTLHVALALLRKERSGSPALLLASFSFAAAPWLLTSPGGLAIGLLLHVAWFAACERFGTPRAAVSAAADRSPARLAPARAERPPEQRPAAGFAPVSVLAAVDETPEIRTFRLARPAGFEFIAGQFLSVRVPVGGKPLVRCYTISSPPEARGYLEISVKRQGAVSSALHASLVPGGMIEIRGPGGHFRYPEGDRRPILLVGGGVGATPLVSMLRHAVAAEPARAVTLLLSVRTEIDVPFRAELEEIERRHPQTRIVVAVTRGAGDPRRFPGRIDESLLRSVAPEAAASTAFVCGPLPMIAAMKDLLARLGLPPERIRAEAFEAAVAWAGEENAGPNAAPREGARVGVLNAPRIRTGDVVFARSGRSAPASATETLLEAAESAGVAIDFSCRSGICGTCRTRLVEGDVEGDAGALDAAERRDGWILPCVSFPKGRCVVDA